MNAVLTSLVAVFATLAGSTLTFVFQRHITRQTERFARSQQLWHERVAAYSAFAAALTDLRRSQNDRWHVEQDAPDSPGFISAREESYQRRADATAALCRVRLICADPDLSRSAQDALDAATTVHLAQDEQDRARRGEKARLALDEFLSTASSHVH
ncbi:hypothetical protein A6A06_12375 [Streptomyces sp. CB02923]|uniref:hypothetical protein n=1 Tax=Streptomyces sp. CB02923 TaxID=1718985 RepID=UPI00093D3BA6|nr:hypothetical protein [Streptomyces sp. CB02923]OKI01921.1 hypothetical protein A6A06_12375 [Streptomyces sp. CB02923]